MGEKFCLWVKAGLLNEDVIMGVVRGAEVACFWEAEVVIGYLIWGFINFSLLLIR